MRFQEILFNEIEINCTLSRFNKSPQETKFMNEITFFAESIYKMALKFENYGTLSSLCRGKFKTGFE